MYSVPHIISTKGNNKGSCRAYAEYLLKDNDFFFNHSSENITLEDGVNIIDDNSKRGLGKEDAKWFAPVYALSEEEAKYIASEITGRNVDNFIDLTPEEQKKYNEYIIFLAKGFQDEMAKNFNKQELGIKNGSNLFYIGVVENRRKYNGLDDEVKLGLKKNGEEKKGFNTHIHIIQSRLANNGKYSKISPMANERKNRVNNLGGKVGFDRNFFKNRVEQYFDRITKYVRNIEETFEFIKAKKKDKDLSVFKVEEVNPYQKEEENNSYERRESNVISTPQTTNSLQNPAEAPSTNTITQNTQTTSADEKEVNKEDKKEVNLSFQQKNKKPKRRNSNELTKEEKEKNSIMLKLIKEKIIQAQEKPVVRKKYIPKKEADRIIGNAKILEYFFYLEKVGLLERQYKKGKDIFYKNLKGELIAVSEKGYRNYTKKSGGQIMKAIQEMQDISWSEALAKIIELNNEQVHIPEVKPKQSFKLLKEYENQKAYLRKPYEELGISVFYTDRFLSAVKFESKGKEISVLGLRNKSGGYYTYNPKFKSFNKVGEGDISVITGVDKDKKNDVVIFSNYIEYMAYLQKNNMSNLKETAIILNDRENADKLVRYLKEEVKGKVYSFADNFILDKMEESQINYQDMRKSHKVEKSTFIEILSIEKGKKKL